MNTFAQPHYRRSGSETSRSWLAPGGVRVTASREAEPGNRWRVTEGPDRLIGRSWRNMRDLRIAVRQSQRESTP